MSNPLDGIIGWYEATSGSLKVARRALASEPAVEGAAAAGRLDAAEESLARLTVLDLAATFERVLRLHVLSEVGRGYSDPGPLAEAIRTELEEDVRYWGFANRLVGVFPNVPPNLLGMVKQVVHFRDWVAHARHMDPRPGERRPIDVTPEEAYRRLTEFLRAAGVMT